jgi:AraC-like DNA-binding protein
MDLQLYTIEPVLQPFIKVICSMESKGPADVMAPFRVLPDTCVELFVNYTDVPLARITGKQNTDTNRSIIVFRMSSFMDVHMQPGSGCIAICFNPGAAYHFFSLPMHEVTDSVAGMDHFWEHASTELEEKVALTHTNKERVSIIQHYLIQLLTKKQKADKAVEYCLWQINLLKGQLSVNQLSEKTGISLRQLGRRFNNCVGLSPKEYTRISRFIHSLPHLKKLPSVSLTEVAYESGYYDQAHFIHDYKEYTGLTPGEVRTSGNIIY